MFVEYGVPFFHVLYYMLWRVRLEAYFIYLHVNVFISIDYGLQDEFNEEEKNIILNDLLDHDIGKVRNYEIVKEILDKLQNMYGG